MYPEPDNESKGIVQDAADLANQTYTDDVTTKDRMCCAR